MANLTKEYLDKALGGLEGRLDKKIDKQSKELKDFIAKEVGDLAAMTARELAAIRRELNVRERMEKLERVVYKISESLNIHV